MSIPTDRKQFKATTWFVVPCFMILLVLALWGCASMQRMEQMDQARDYSKLSYDAALQCSSPAQIEAAFEAYPDPENVKASDPRFGYRPMAFRPPGGTIYLEAEKKARIAGADDIATKAAALAAYMRWLINFAEFSDKKAIAEGKRRDAALAAEAASHAAAQATAAAAAAAHRANSDYAVAAEAIAISSGIDPAVVLAAARVAHTPDVDAAARTTASDAGLGTDAANAAAVAAATEVANAADPDAILAVNQILANARQAAYDNALGGADVTAMHAQAAARGVIQEILRFVDPDLQHLQLTVEHIRSAGYDEAYKVVEDINDEVELAAASTAAARAQIAAVNSLKDAGIDLRARTGLEQLAELAKVQSDVMLAAIGKGADRDTARAAANDITIAAFNTFQQARDNTVTVAFDKMKTEAKDKANASVLVRAAKAYADVLEHGSVTLLNFTTNDPWQGANSAALQARATCPTCIADQIQTQFGADHAAARNYAEGLVAAAVAKVSYGDALNAADSIVRIVTREMASAPENPDEAILNSSLAAATTQAIGAAVVAAQQANDAWGAVYQSTPYNLKWDYIAAAYSSACPQSTAYTGSPQAMACNFAGPGDARIELGNSNGLLSLAEARANKIAEGYSVPLIEGSPLAADDRPKLRTQAWVIAKETKGLQKVAFRYLRVSTKTSTRINQEATAWVTTANEAAADAATWGAKVLPKIRDICSGSQTPGIELIRATPISGVNFFDSLNPTGRGGTGLPSGANPRLTVIWAGGGEGIVTSNPPGMNCSHVSGSTCQVIFSPGQSVNLIPNPASGSIFSHWGVGECDQDFGATGCIVNMISDRSINVFIE